MESEPGTRPRREVRADYDDLTLVVYQAFGHTIADAALAAGTLVPPFSHTRMTWIKPSFLWMMYRSQWATRPGQERILAIRILRSGFEHALGMAALSRYDPAVHATHHEWRQLLDDRPVRVQWDPDRARDLSPLPWRCIQIGLAGTVVRDYTSQWITAVVDITPIVREMRNTVPESLDLPPEMPYRLPPEIARVIGTAG